MLPVLINQIGDLKVGKVGANTFNGEKLPSQEDYQDRIVTWLGKVSQFGKGFGSKRRNITWPGKA